MLGGALGLTTASHKQLHRPSTPIDLEAWRDALLQSAKNHDDSSMDCIEGSSDVSGTASVGAINLSSRPSSAPTGSSAPPGGHNSNNMDAENQDDGVHKNHCDRDAPLGNDDVSTPIGNGKISPLPFIPPGLQQMQQLLQSQLAGFNPAQLQQLMQQQQQILNHHQQQLADVGRKQLEQLMHQLQEQLQINLLQQSHLMQTGEKAGPKTQAAMQQLQIQQQQLISQLQLVQQRILLLPNFHPRKDDFVDRAWKESAREHLQKSLAHKNGNYGSKYSEEKEDLRNSSSNTNAPRESINNSSGATHEKLGMQHPLFSNGVCQWPGCESHFNDLVSFLKHVGSEHILDDKSTAQARVQMQIVAQLEHSLHKERERLQAMMAHLHLTKEMHNKSKSVESEKNSNSNNNNNNNNEKSNNEASNEGPRMSPISSGGMAFNDRPKQSPPKLRVPPGMNHPHGGPPHGVPNHPAGSLAAAMQGFGHLPSLAAGLPAGMGLHPPTPLSALTAAARSPGIPPSLQPPMSPMGPPVRRRLSDKAPLPIASVGLPYLFDRAGLDIAQEIHRNREFYRTHDVRPPFTYASLIRQAVIESPENQLTLHEIYSWFTTTFAYFRRNRASWKNAVRHNLSLHKCFMRVENVRGAVWTVDEVEYHRRRPQRGAAAGVHSKSPSFGHSPSMYSEALNASLQSALGFGDGPLPFMGQSLAEASMLHQQHRERQHQREQEEKHHFKERSPTHDYSGKFPESHQFMSPTSMHGDESPGGEHNNNNNGEMDIKNEDIEANARRMARKRAAEMYQDVEDDNIHYDDDIIDDDISAQDDISANDISANDLSPSRENLFRHHQQHMHGDYDLSDQKEKIDENGADIMTNRRMVEDDSANEEKCRGVKREKF